MNAKSDEDSGGTGPSSLDRQNPISRSSGKRPSTGQRREPSRAEEEGVPSTDTSARSPLDVGRSYGRRGENVVRAEGKEAGRRESGTSAHPERSAGKSSGRDTSSVNPHKASE
jgi:hypothetical protein